MKVYAEYFEEKGSTFRTNTILQFGDSWNLIGNIVLANPGSACQMKSYLSPLYTIKYNF